MGKRIAIISSVVIAIVLIIAYFIEHQGKKNLVTDPYKAVPKEACIVIETGNINRFLEKLKNDKGVLSLAFGTDELAGVAADINFFSALTAGAKSSFPGIDGRAIISFVSSNEKTFVPLVAMSVPGTLTAGKIVEFLNSSGMKASVLSRKHKITLIAASFSSGNISGKVFVAVSPGLLVISNSEKTAEQSLSQNRNGDIRDMPGFSRVLASSGKMEDKFFIIFPNLSPVINKLFREPHQGFAKMISGAPLASEGDIYLNSSGLVLSGYSVSHDTSSLLKNSIRTSPASIQSVRILPSSTFLVESVILPDGPAKINRANNGKSEKQYIEEISSFIGKEITRAVIGTHNNSSTGNTVFVYELNDPAAAGSLLSTIAGRKGTFNYSPDDQVSIPIYHIGPLSLAHSLSPVFTDDRDESVFTVYDRFLISGSSEASLTSFLYDNILNKTLENEEVYKEFEKTIPQKGAYFFYCSPAKMQSRFREVFNDSVSAFFDKNSEALSRIRAAGLRLASSNNMLYNIFSVTCGDPPAEEKNTEWETLLDTIAATKPFIFTNHYTRAKEIFIQDLGNKIYLINSAGRVLWKVPLDERINGQVYLVDYFRNGKYQLLFAGRNFLHIIDRNGNYVERYPVRLRAPASGPPALFDYDNDLSYRIIIPGEDKLIYSYDIKGGVVKGWTPFRTADTITSEVAFFRVLGKDYLVVAGTSSLYVLDRKGERRIIPSETVNKARKSAIRVMNGKKPCFVFSDPAGRIIQLFPDGKIVKKGSGSMSVDHSFDYFDIDGDGIGEYIFIDNGKLYLYDQNMKELFTRDFNSPGLGGPINFVFSGTDRKIGVFDRDRNLIYLIGRNGETMTGFPVKGASMFSVGRLTEGNGWNLIVGGTDKFLYNYKIDRNLK